MVKYSLFLILGIIIGWFVCYTMKPINNAVEVVTKQTDTLYQQVNVKVPVPYPVVQYVSIKDSIFKNIKDTTYLKYYVNVHDNIPVNVYNDSINTQNYKLKYNITTIGQMLEFNHSIMFTHNPEIIVKTVKPKWIITGAISNKGNFKVGAGYKGWVVEAELKENFNQVFFGYHYQF